VRNESTILHALLNRKIDIREGGRVRKVTVLEAMLLRFTEDSLKGDTKSAAFLLNRYSATVSDELSSEIASSDDKLLIDAFAQRVIQSQRKE
jgi:Family of unknown function (DUF5681)